MTPESLGQYWTPPALASRIVSWAQVRLGDCVLEPSCGAGRLLEPLIGRCKTLVALDIDDFFADRAADLWDSIDAYAQDFATFDCNRSGYSFDLAIMNPPDVKGSGRLHVAHALDLCQRVVVLHRAAILHSREADRLIWQKHTLSRLVLLHRGLVKFDGPADNGHGAMQEWIVAEILRGKHEHVQTRVEWWLT